MSAGEGGGGGGGGGVCMYVWGVFRSWLSTKRWLHSVLYKVKIVGLSSRHAVNKMYIIYFGPSGADVWANRFFFSVFFFFFFFFFHVQSCCLPRRVHTHTDFIYGSSFLSFLPLLLQSAVFDHFPQEAGFTGWSTKT